MPKRIKKEQKKLQNHEIEVFTSIKITKSGKKGSQTGSAKKSKSKATPKKDGKSVSKSPVTKAIVRKRIDVDEQKPK